MSELHILQNIFKQRQLSCEWKYSFDNSPKIVFMLSPCNYMAKARQFLSLRIKSAGLTDWLVINLSLCEEKNIMCDCYQNIAKIIVETKPKILVPCGDMARGLFHLIDNDEFVLNSVFLSHGRNGKAKPTIVMPLEHPANLMIDKEENTTRYLNFAARLNYIKTIGYMFNSCEPNSDLLAEFGVDHAFLFENGQT